MKKRKADPPCKVCPECYCYAPNAQRICHNCGSEFPKKPEPDEFERDMKEAGVWGDYDRRKLTR